MKVEKVAAKRARVHTTYKLKDGTLVAGVTTALGILNKPAILPWAVGLAFEGINYRTYVDALAQVGTVAHSLILAHHKNEKFDPQDLPADIVDKAENSLLSYLEWERHHRVEPILCEVGFVSERYRFGGTIDLVAKIDGVLTLADYKSSKSLYPEHVYQCAAYRQLLIENEVDVTAVRILRVGREETEGFTDRPVTARELEVGADIFNHCLQIYNLKKANPWQN